MEALSGRRRTRTTSTSCTNSIHASMLHGMLTSAHRDVRCCSRSDIRLEHREKARERLQDQVCVDRDCAGADD